MPRKKILVVDDDQALAETTKTVLDDSGLYEACVVTRPKAVRRTAREFMPALILMDVIMPEMDGGTVAAQIRADDGLKHIPIVFLTSVVGKDEARIHDGIIGKERFIAKPANVADLLAAVESIVRRGT